MPGAALLDDLRVGCPSSTLALFVMVAPGLLISLSPTPLGLRTHHAITQAQRRGVGWGVEGCEPSPYRGGGRGWPSERIALLRAAADRSPSSRSLPFRVPTHTLPPPLPLALRRVSRRTNPCSTRSRLSTVPLRRLSPRQAVCTSSSRLLPSTRRGVSGRSAGRSRRWPGWCCGRDFFCQTRPVCKSTSCQRPHGPL